jgi:hypothetical protein
VFIKTVSGCAVGHFRASDLPLLERYAEACALAEQAAEKLAVEGAVVDDKLSPWFTAHQGACKTVSSLALRLRLGPQSRAPRAPKTVAAPTSYYEELELEGSDDDEAKPGRS